MQLRIPTHQEELVIEIAEDRLIADCSRPRAANGQANRVVAEALAAPLGYPELAQAVIPGDHVAIAVDPDLPEPAEVVGEVLSTLLHADVQASDVTVVVANTRGGSEQSLRAAWPESWNDVQVVQHQSDDASSHTYLAATQKGQPIYLNRAIGDADVVIPIGTVRSEQSFDFRGVHGSWFPAFSNVETQLRYQSPGNLEWRTHERRRREETNEAAWLLGVSMVVQVLPGANGSVAGAWYGEADQVAEAGAKAFHDRWSFTVDRPADLVIAVVDGEQSWRHMARALAMASQATVEGGAIVLWTDLADDPGPALRSLGEFELSEEQQRLALLKARSADAVAAKVIADALRNNRVYLRSKLDDTLVEEISLAPLHSGEELQRLIGSQRTCIAIGSAQYAEVRVKQPVEA